MLKMTGAEFKAFYTDKSVWLDGRWHDDGRVSVDGRDDDDLDCYCISDGAKVEIDGGFIYDDHGNNVCGMETAVKRWRKARTHVDIVFSVPKEREEAVRAAVKAALA